MIFSSKHFYLAIYYGIAYNLPNYSFPFGKFFNAFRISILRKFIYVGKDCRIMKKIYLGDGNNVRIGENCRINEGVRLDNVMIGDNVLIARESIILGKMHEYADVHVPISQQGERTINPTIIEDDVWLGLRVIVLPGVTLKKGTIVGAGAVVCKSTEEGGIYGGVPARLIRYRSQVGDDKG